MKNSPLANEARQRLLSRVASLNETAAIRPAASRTAPPARKKTALDATAEEQENMPETLPMMHTPGY